MDKASKEYDLIIFDCDGTLVDSEVLNNSVTADLLTDFGLKGYTSEFCTAMFAGKSWQDIKVFIEQKENIILPRSIIDDYIQTVQERLPTELQIIEGAFDFVRSVNDHYKICVGSNGERGNVTKSLELTALDQYFPDQNVFTKVQVANPKPAPDLFLFAADKMGTDPERCLVLEDSISGAQAGVAAGMDVIGFTGVSHNKKESEKQLKDIGVMAVFDDFIHIATYLGH